jgi:hypothetical protein
MMAKRIARRRDDAMSAGTAQRGSTPLRPTTDTDSKEAHVDLSSARLAALNSATKYPSIETFHVLGERGALTEQVGPFWGAEPKERVFLTEKVDGTNGRIILLPGGDYFIGSREELLYAEGDRVENPALSIVEVLKPLAEELIGLMDQNDDLAHVVYLEVYGGKVGAQAKQYSGLGGKSARMFDVAAVDLEWLDESRERISTWRENGGQDFYDEKRLNAFSQAAGLPRVPLLGSTFADLLPTSVEGMSSFLRDYLPNTRVALDAEAGNKAEGIVFRTENRNRIAKARFQDYERTLKRRK